MSLFTSPESVPSFECEFCNNEYWILYYEEFDFTYFSWKTKPFDNELLDYSWFYKDQMKTDVTSVYGGLFLNVRFVTIVSNKSNV